MAGISIDPGVLLAVCNNDSGIEAVFCNKSIIPISKLIIGRCLVQLYDSLLFAAG